MKHASLLPLIVCLLPGWSLAAEPALAQKPAKKQAPFQWVNPLKATGLPGLSHSTFHSTSMKIDVGYCIYKPPGYNDRRNARRRYPVVYYLHGGRPGSEIKSVRLVPVIHEQMTTGRIPPMLYVFVNGGPVSHYNMPDRTHAMGEDVFIKELIPHVDKTERTIANRNGRALEGFSQGGRGTTRIMFRHPALFCSAAPGGAGHATEKLISENDGRENENLKFTPGYNTWDLARAYAADPTPSIKILVHVGTKGFNYQNNLEYMKFLDSLKIPYQRLVVEGVPHSAMQIYQRRGLEIMQFHVKNFRQAGGIPAGIEK